MELKEQIKKMVDEMVEGWNEKDHPRGKDGKSASVAGAEKDRAQGRAIKKMGR